MGRPADLSGPRRPARPEHRINTSVGRPSDIALYFSVETHNGYPVAGLNAKGFRAGCHPKRRSDFSLRRDRMKR